MATIDPRLIPPPQSFFRFAGHDLMTTDQVVSILANKVSNSDILQKPDYHPDHDHVHVRIIKDSCSSVWCRQCWSKKGGARRFADALSKMSWDSVRHVIITCDPKKFPAGPRAAYEQLRAWGAVSSFIRNLTRFYGINVLSYRWVMEWHKTELPHYHVFIDVGVSGSRGMIGNKKLLAAWPFGRVQERRVYSSDHWERFTGYFGQMGYFKGDKKGHQAELPSWARDVDYQIRKTGGSINKSSESFPDDSEPRKYKPRDERRPYSQILSSCGQSTILQITRAHCNSVFTKIAIPFDVVKKYPSTIFEAGKGYVFQCKHDYFPIYFDYLNRLLTRKSRGLALC